MFAPAAEANSEVRDVLFALAAEANSEAGPFCMPSPQTENPAGRIFIEGRGHKSRKKEAI